MSKARDRLVGRREEPYTALGTSKAIKRIRKRAGRARRRRLNQATRGT